MRQPIDRYDGVAQSFHWLVVLLVVAQYATKLLPGRVRVAEREATERVAPGDRPDDPCC